MTKDKAYRSEAAAAIHETASGLFEAGVIDKRTMRDFDETCLTPIQEFTPKQIKALREREQVSQTVFAFHLNVSKDSVSQWERGEKRPAGPSLKLLSLIKRKGLAAIA
ncbi:MAG TPA: DNA-binding transcriptional regulator [Pyrinomonadaceae bacterium]|nr:DNA-binding transcriptional regulator [Pyrinomonadaceae bacterium]HMP65438.1 DNA-binding transcriptional regulator [Pyrinomonadaceae bacterium]